MESAGDCLEEIPHGEHQVAVIGHGGLEEFGTYEELLAKKGKFYELKELQM